MEKFEYWDQDITDFIKNNCRKYLSNISKHNNKILLIYGENNSGKNTLVNHICKKYLKNDVQLIRYENHEIVVEKYPFELQENIHIHELLPDFSLSTEGIQPSAGITLPITKLYKYFSNKKLNNVLYFKDVEQENNIDIHTIKTILKDIPGKSIVIITTSDKQIFDDFIEEDIIARFCIPKIKKDSKDFQNYETSILRELKKLSNEDYKKIIDLSHGNYGNIKLLLNHDIISFIEQIYSSKQETVDNENEKNKQKLILSIFLLSNFLSEEALEDIFSDTDYDYISEFEKLIESSIIDKQYKFNDLIWNSREGFIKNFYNKRTRRDIALKLEYYLKLNYPENYSLRAKILKGIDNRKYKSLVRISNLRNPKNLTESEDKFIEFITDIEKNEHDYIMFNKSELTLLELAEFQIHFFNCITKSSSRNYELIHFIIMELFNTYEKMINLKEIELAIRVGIVVSIGAINYNVSSKLDMAKKVYLEITDLIDKKIVQKNNYYISYSIFCKIICAGFIPYQEAYYTLYGLINDLKTERFRSSNINLERIFPIALGNFLGVSMYLENENMLNAKGVYDNSFDILDNFKFKKFKLKNNALLITLFLSNNIRDDIFKVLSEFNKINNTEINQAFKINYAGLLFYKEESPIKSLHILEKILNQDEGKDDFYQFYCNYNICIIKIKLGKITEAIEISKDLKTPTIFSDNTVKKIIEKRIEFLKNYLLDNSNKHNWSEFQIQSNDYFNKFEGIFSQAWSFTDIQYWNDVLQ
ncbi:hypothetical protein [Pseudolactococcus reticulitermitis]|uniref:NB-ARC domain-containing protein n=1 Tax=Pseudolactococcus reticulitermitis TaxID=2025039 RepID=A0A224XD95_9LACT|nr:hypothetical protein [Lactococcus reticulitermitis]GAX47625.1 hypothetical protein RsY01_1225 [Lactococcus reticulitermitis]